MSLVFAAGIATTPLALVGGVRSAIAVAPARLGGQDAGVIIEGEPAPTARDTWYAAVDGADIQALLNPPRLVTRADALTRPCPIPAAPGVYAWYFDEPPAAVPTSGSHSREGWTLLYVGISPKEPSRSGGAPSRQTLRTRVRYHYRGNASGSTLRLTLGSLLSEELGIQLRRVGSGQRLTFSDGEATLSDWMATHARVCWVSTAQPWLLESQLITQLVVPLNLDQNTDGSFRSALAKARADQRAQARALPVVPR